MVNISIEQDACRGCSLCADECPVEVFIFQESDMKAEVQTADDCIACLSCYYLCPSEAITLSEYHLVKNFYRDIQFSKRAEKFL